MTVFPVGTRLWTTHRASVSLPDTSALLELTVLAVAWTAGVRSDTSAPSSLGPSSLVACASQGSACPIVGSSCSIPGRISFANVFVGPNEAFSAVSALFVVRSSGGSAAIVALRSCWRAASALSVVSKLPTRLASWLWRDASARNTSSLPWTYVLRSCAWVPSSASLTIAEALNAPAEYFSDLLSAWPAVRPRTLGSWEESCAGVGCPLSEAPRPRTSVCRLPRASELSAARTRSSWTGPEVLAAGSVSPDDSTGAFGVPGCRST